MNNTARSTSAAAANIRAPATFATRPDDAVIADFFQHLATTGEPHVWSQHQHTPPSRDAKPVLLRSFALPDAIKARPDRWAKCPLCAPIAPKYTWGYLVWFPESEGGDGYLRAIGHDCGARFFGKERYRQAVGIYRREQDEQAERDLLDRALPSLPSLAAWIVAIKPWADAAHAMRTSFRAALPREFIDALTRAEAGMLTIEKPLAVPFRRADGSTGTRMESRPEAVGQVRGQGILAHAMANIESEHMAATATAAQLSQLPPARDADAVLVAAKAVRKLKQHVEALAQSIADAVAFAEPDNLTLLRRWSCHPNSSAPAQFVMIDDPSKVSVIRYRRIGMPQLGMRPKTIVEIPTRLGRPPPPAPAAN